MWLEDGIFQEHSWRRFITTLCIGPRNSSWLFWRWCIWSKKLTSLFHGWKLTSKPVNFKRSSQSVHLWVSDLTWKPRGLVSRRCLGAFIIMKVWYWVFKTALWFTTPRTTPTKQKKRGYWLFRRTWNTWLHDNDAHLQMNKTNVRRPASSAPRAAENALQILQSIVMHFKKTSAQLSSARLS